VRRGSLLVVVVRGFRFRRWCLFVSPCSCSEATLVDMWKLISSRPTRLQALVVSGVALITSFGIDWTAEQVSVVTAFSAALISLVLETPKRNPVL